MKYLKEWTEQRREIAKLYDGRLGAVGDIVTPRADEGIEHVYHLYVVRTAFRDELKAYLANAGISTNINYPVALPFLKAYRKFEHSKTDFPNAFKHQQQILSLPMYPGLNLEQIDHVCSTVERFFMEYGV